MSCTVAAVVLVSSAARKQTESKPVMSTRDESVVPVPAATLLETRVILQSLVSVNIAGPRNICDRTAPWGLLLLRGRGRLGVAGRDQAFGVGLVRPRHLIAGIPRSRAGLGGRHERYQNR